MNLYEGGFFWKPSVTVRWSSPESWCAVGRGWVLGVVLGLSPRSLRVSSLLPTEWSRQQLRGPAWRFPAARYLNTGTYVSVQQQGWVDTILQGQRS